MDTFGSFAVCMHIMSTLIALDAPIQNNTFSLDAQKTSGGGVASHPDRDAEYGITVTKVWFDYYLFSY